MDLSPGRYTEEYAERIDSRRKKREQIAQLPTYKKRKAELKKERNILKGSKEALEGDEYQSGMYASKKNCI